VGPTPAGSLSGHVAATCRYYGIRPQCYYGWLRRYESDGLQGLKDRWSRPHKILWLCVDDVRSPRVSVGYLPGW
jgi:hypothetical protein